jgi:hypothetical protein
VAAVVEATTPVVAAVVEAVEPVVAPVVQALPPLVEAVGTVVTPVVGAVGPVVGSAFGAGPSPPTDRLDATRPSPASRALSTGAPLAPLPVPGLWRGAGANGDTPVPELGSSSVSTAGKSAAASAVPPAPLGLPALSAVPGLGGSGSGGAGSSSLAAILAGGVPGMGLARGGVVHDRAARLTSLVRGPGRLPG